MQDFRDDHVEVSDLSFDHEDETIVGKIGVGAVQYAEIWQVRHRYTFICVRSITPDVVYRATVASDNFDR